MNNIGIKYLGQLIFRQYVIQAICPFQIYYKIDQFQKQFISQKNSFIQMIPNQGGFRQKPQAQDNSNFKSNKGTAQKSVNFDMNQSGFSGTQSSMVPNAGPQRNPYGVQFANQMSGVSSKQHGSSLSPQNGYAKVNGRGSEVSSKEFNVRSKSKKDAKGKNVYDEGAPEVTDGSDVPINLKNDEPRLKFDDENGPTYRDFDDQDDFQANVGNLKSSGGFNGKNYNRSPYDERDTPILSSTNKRNAPMPNISKLKTDAVKRPDPIPVSMPKANTNVNMNTKIKTQIQGKQNYTALQHDDGVDNSMESYEFSQDGDKRLSMLQDTRRQNDLAGNSRNRMKSPDLQMKPSLNGMNTGGTSQVQGTGRKAPSQKSSDRKQLNTKVEVKEMSPRQSNVPKKEKTVVKPTPKPVSPSDVKLDQFSRAPTGYFIKGDEYVDVDKNIKSYDAPELGENKKPDQSICDAQGRLLPKNEVIRFATPKSDLEIDHQIFDYYTRNTFVRNLDTDEDPLPVAEETQKVDKRPLQKQLTSPIEETTIKDVRNIHIASDHQRAYVWVLSWPKTTGSLVQNLQKKSLWLQVYSLASGWSSKSTLGSEQIRKMSKLQDLRDQVKCLETEFSAVASIVLPEENPQNLKSQNKSMIHKNAGVQGEVDKARKDQKRRSELLKQKKQQVQEFEKQFYQEMSEYLGNGEHADHDQESKNFHLVENYQSTHKAPEKDHEEPDNARNYLQQSQKADLSILIGEFDAPKQDYLYDPIQSYWKQFVTSTQSLYFFKFEDDTDVEKEISQLVPRETPASANFNDKRNSLKSGKTNAESESSKQARTPPGTKGQNVDEQKKQGPAQPYLYEMNAYSNKCQKVRVNGKSICLPIDENTNQFAIIRPMDPKNSRQMSYLDNFMVAIMKEIHVKPDPIPETDSARRQQEDSGRRRKSTKRGPPLQPKYVETIVEIYKDNFDIPTLGANVDLKEISPEFDPKNISAFHKNEESDGEDKKPVNVDFNFCVWYLVDKRNHNLNFSILLNNQQVNMRTPYDLDPTMAPQDEIKKRIIVARNYQFCPNGEHTTFLQNFDLSAQMPIYSIDMLRPINFSKQESFKESAKDAKTIWQKELGKQIGREDLLNINLLVNGGLPSPNLPETQLQNLVESQEAVCQNLDVELERFYLIIHQRPTDMDFEVLYPIIPDYFWCCPEGQQLRKEIDQRLLKAFNPYLEEDVNYMSYKDYGVNEGLYYSKITDKLACGQHKQFSKRIDQKLKRGEQVRQYTQEKVQQTATYHQIYLNENQFQHFSPATLHNYGIKSFPSILTSFTSLILTKSFQQNKQAQKTHQNSLVGQAVKDRENQKKASGGKSRGKSTTNDMIQMADSGAKSQLPLPLSSPRSTSVAVLKSPRMNRAQTVVTPQQLKQTQSNAGCKSRFEFEKFVISEDNKSFIYVIKYRKKHFVRKNSLGEIIRTFYRGKYFAFEEDFEYFDYEIKIGSLEMGANKHMIHFNEERQPLRRTQQLMTQFCISDCQAMPLQNPFTPYQSLLMLHGIGEQKAADDQLRDRFLSLDSFVRSQQPKREETEPLKIYQVCLKDQQQVGQGERSLLIENLTKFKNLPSEASYIEMLRNPEMRRRFYLDYIKQHNVMREVSWGRNDVLRYSLQDYMNEQSKVRVWVEPDDIARRQQQTYEVRMVGIFQEVFSTFRKFQPQTQYVLDASSKSPHPQGWEVMRKLFIEKYSLQTIKQDRHNSRNVVLALMPRYEDDQPMMADPNQTINCHNIVLHFVGTLDNTFEKFENLKVIKQSLTSKLADEEYENKLAPLNQVETLVEAYNYLDFTKEFVDLNKWIDQTSAEYCHTFPKAYRKARMVAFDTSFGDSFGRNVDLFAIKMWAPHNSIKFFEYDFLLGETKEIYEIPVDSDKLDKIQGIQLARISDEALTYSLLIDWCSYKEIFTITFTRTKQKKQNKKVRNHYTYDSKAFLMGKIDLINPNLFESSFEMTDGKNTGYVNQTLKMYPLYKTFEGKEDPQRDGFSVLVDQVRMDFDLKYFENLPGKDRIKYYYQSHSSVFEYEYQHSKKIKQNINPECIEDNNFYQFLILKVKFREEILDNNVFTENQKCRLLRYFAKTLQANSSPDYSQLFETVKINPESQTDKDVQDLILPRYELYGSNILNFKCLDTELVENTLERVLYQLGDSEAPENKTNFFACQSKSLIHDFLPVMSESAGWFQSHQLTLYSRQNRFCEMDMNMMSPITWALYRHCHNSAKHYVKFFKKYSGISDEEAHVETIRDHAPIFYGAVKHLLEIGIIDLEEFLNPDGVGADVGCELFQQTLPQKFLPQFDPRAKTFTNEYARSFQSLERNMTQALMIKSIMRPQNFQDEDACHTGINEVQYGFMDLDWLNVLNVFDQQPLGILSARQSKKKPKRQSASAKRQPQIEDGYSQSLLNFKQELQNVRERKRPLVDYISKYPKIDIFKYESVKILIDHNWESLAYDFFKTQFWIFLMMFLLPFTLDLYYLNDLVEHQVIQVTHIIFNSVALGTQLLFFLNEMVQMSIKGSSLADYFTDFWNQNDITSFPVYLALNIVIWVCVRSDYAAEADPAVRIGDDKQRLPIGVEISIKVLYMIVVVQTFIKFLFLARIFKNVAFLIHMIGCILRDLRPFLVIVLVHNIVFSALYVILAPPMSEDYTFLWPPVKWMVFTFRNALHDFQIADEDGQGFFQDHDPASAKGNTMLYLTWLTWFGNVFFMTLILFNVVIAIMGQTYEKILGDMEAHIYKLKAEMVVEAQQVSSWLGNNGKLQDYQKTIIVRKQRFHDDIAERLNKEEWQGCVSGLKTYLQFCVIKRIEGVELQQDVNRKRVDKQVKDLNSSVHAVNETLYGLGKQTKRVQDTLREAMRVLKGQNNQPVEDQFDLSRSHITYNGNMNNVSH